jgi:hypothetical protein
MLKGSDIQFVRIFETDVWIWRIKSVIDIHLLREASEQRIQNLEKATSLFLLLYFIQKRFFHCTGLVTND